jgi:hypothetical protein
VADRQIGIDCVGCDPDALRLPPGRGEESKDYGQHGQDIEGVGSGVFVLYMFSHWMALIVLPGGFSRCYER